jgi:hypothetical protein
MQGRASRPGIVRRRGKRQRHTSSRTAPTAQLDHELRVRRQGVVEDKTDSPGGNVLQQRVADLTRRTSEETTAWQLLEVEARGAASFPTVRPPSRLMASSAWRWRSASAGRWDGWCWAAIARWYWSGRPARRWCSRLALPRTGAGLPADGLAAGPRTDRRAALGRDADRGGRRQGGLDGLLPLLSGRSWPRSPRSLLTG